MNMSIDQWLKYIESLHPKTMDLGLETVRQVGTRAGILQPHCPVVLVAGTNGKGSTIYALEKLLQCAGKKVGCYTSPHLSQFNERIRINGKDVSDQSLISAFEAIERYRKDIQLTYFEFTTLAAFYLFHQQVGSLDILLCEIGLGGRLDAVNCLEPDLSIITTIDYDHEDWLGNDLEKIAFEKAGILRQNKPCVLGKNVNQKSIADRIKELGCITYSSDKDFFSSDALHQNWSMQDISANVPQNDLPENSVSIALASYNILKSVMSVQPLNEVVGCLNNFFMPGRYQRMGTNPQIILDVAHNRQSCDYLKQRLIENTSKSGKGKRIAVWAMLEDKPIEYVAKTFKSLFSDWYVPKLEVARALSAEKLCQILQQAKINRVHKFRTVSAALECAIQNAGEKDQIVVFGSFHVVGDAITHLKGY